MTRLVPRLLLAVTAAAPLLAQTENLGARAAAATLRTPVPIHTHAADPIGGAYGLWTAGADFKASFHDGFVFYPWIPGARTTRGLHWRTLGVQLGEQELLGTASAPRHDAFHCEIERGAVVEVYDVRAEGVEQSFRIAVRPAGTGDLVVEGTIETPFTAAPTAERHGPIDFLADGSPAMRYGAAFAFDAAGARTEVTTSFDGERLRLRVPAAFVAAATFPLTVDPLSSTASQRSSAQPIVATSVTTASPAGIARVYLAVAREFSATDHDAYVFIDADDPVTMLDVFTDVTTSWSTNTVDLADIAGASSWGLAIEREFPASSTVAARVHVQGYGAALNGGTTLFAAVGTTNPKIGGMLGAGTQALVVFGSGGDCRQQLVDGATPALGASTLHQAQATDWAITSHSFPGSTWCVASRAGASPQLRVRLVDTAGSLDVSHVVPGTANADGPALDGSGTRYLLTWTDTAGSPLQLRRLRAQRFDLFPAQAPTYGPLRTLSSVSLLTGFSRRDVAFDHRTTSHWVVAFHTSAALASSFTGRLLRVGHTGGTTESIDLNTIEGTEVVLPCACNSGLLTTGTYFAAAWAVNGVPLPRLVHRRLDYGPAALSYYGTSCANPTLGDGHAPYAGSEFYRMNLHAPVPSTICLHAIGTTAQNVPLDSIGMLGCNLLVDPILTTAVVADGSGLATAVYALPDSPLFVGDLRAQWFWVEPAANPFGWRSSPGELVEVR